MSTVDKALLIQLLYSAVDDVNQQLPRAKRLDKSLDAPLSGEGGRLDSLGLVNLLFATEQKLESEFNASVTLMDDAAMGADANPFRTLGTMADHVAAVLEKKLNA